MTTLIAEPVRGSPRQRTRAHRVPPARAVAVRGVGRAVHHSHPRPAAQYCRVLDGLLAPVTPEVSR